MDKLIYERKHQESGKKYIAGVDEVGRGPLAGPVVCASVIMPLDDIIEGIDDSKKISEKKRQIACACRVIKHFQWECGLCLKE